MKIRQMINGEFEVRHRLNSILDEYPLQEEHLVKLCDVEHIDLGANYKPRLNYLVSLQMLRKPMPVQYGKGKGGARFFQQDAFEVLQFVETQRGDFALNEIRGIILERREDLINKACRELEITSHVLDPPTLIEAARADVRMKCLFDYDLIKADVLALKLGVIHDLLVDLCGEIAALKSFHKNLEAGLCKDCQPEVTLYIEGKEGEKKKLLDTQRKDLEIGKDLIEKLSG